ncbi:MAG TPA: PEGA domain-containing protein [Vicinamibacterales bacterium]|nr:PEGA domain-containing protein [Vicinamibacterales bacterium]
MKAGSFTLFVPAFVLAGVSLAYAQQLPPQPPPQPPATASLPPAPAALSVPDPLAGFRQGPRDLYQSPDGSDRFQHLSRYPVPPPIVFPPVYFPGPYYSPFGYGYGAPSETSMAETYRMSMAENYLRRQRDAARDASRGTLVLEDVPDNAQVHVDGHYVGLAEEFASGGRSLSLDAGAHRIELRAPGYETQNFSVMIEQNGTLRYRGDMQRLAATSAAPAAAAAAPRSAPARSLYVIPNCYAGDKPPTGPLPKGCDLKNLHTRK